MATATGSTIARNGNGRRLPRHQARMIQTEIKFVLNQDEGSYGASFFGLKWYTIAPPHRYNFSPALTFITGQVDQSSFPESEWMNFIWFVHDYVQITILGYSPARVLQRDKYFAPIVLA